MIILVYQCACKYYTPEYAQKKGEAYNLDTQVHVNTVPGPPKPCNAKTAFNILIFACFSQKKNF